MTELEGKVAIVTGGSGGLGVAIVRELMAAGATVFVPYTNEAHFTELQKQVGNQLAGQSLDLTDEAAVQAVYAQVAAQHGGLHLLVNSAGGFAGGKPVYETPWATWQQQLDMNVKTAVISCAAATPHLIASGGDAIVNISSRTATQPGAMVAAYGAAKRAVIGLTEALAAELLQQNITVNAVLPSVIDTPQNRAGNAGNSGDNWVKPEEIARVVRFLVGPNARIISGSSVPVYGRA